MPGEDGTIGSTGPQVNFVICHCFFPISFPQGEDGELGNAGNVGLPGFPGMRV